MKRTLSIAMLFAVLLQGAALYSLLQVVGPQTEASQAKASQTEALHSGLLFSELDSVFSASILAPERGIVPHGRNGAEAETGGSDLDDPEFACAAGLRREPPAPSAAARVEGASDFSSRRALLFPIRAPPLTSLYLNA